MGRYIFTNGKIFTGSNIKPFCDALAVLGKHILCIGSNSDIRMATDDSFEIIDLKGRALVPGFADAHIHLLEYSLSLERVDLNGIMSEEEILKKVSDKAKQSEPGQWIIGNGWDKNIWYKPKWPTKEGLDMAAPNNPVILYNKDIHSIWVNSLALKEAGLLDATLFTEGGIIERDTMTGIPTGILKENAIQLVRNIIPKLNREEIETVLKKGISKLNNFGIVSIHDVNGTNLQDYISLRQKEELDVRILSAIHAKDLDAAIDLGIKTGFGDEWVKVGPLKLFADGSLGSQTAHMLKPYEGGPENFGISTTSKEEIENRVKKAAMHGISSAVHAIGDAANRDVLDVFETLEGIYPKNKLRNRIEHAQLIDADDIRRFSELSVVASMQPIHILQDITTAERYWGGRSRWAYPFRSLLRSGAMLAFGSDAPVASPNPMEGIFTSVARRRIDNSPETGWYSEERLTVEESIRAYTYAPAWLAQDEKLRGKLTAGRLADLVILSQDIFRLPVMEIPHTKVDATMVGGKFVYRNI